METETLQPLDNQKVLQTKKLHDILKKDEKVLFSDEVIKINKYDARQKRNIMLTTEALYNLESDNLLTKIFVNSKGMVKRRISLSSIKSIVYANLGNEFVINVPDEFDYRISTPYKDMFLKYLMAGLKLNEITEMLFYFTEEIELHDFCTHRSEKASGLIRKPHGKSKLMTYETFKDMLFDKDIDEQQASEKTATILGDQQFLGKKTQITLNDFELIKTQGKGGFGTVYLAQKKDTGEYFALKGINKMFVVEKDYFESVMREKQILQELDNPFLVNLKCAFHTPEKLFLVMPFIQGGDQQQHLKIKKSMNKRFSENDVKFYIAQIILALQVLHSKNIVYQDLKPENVLQHSNGYIKLTDFGAAKYVTQCKNYKNFIGTANYVAPEVLVKEPYTKQFDWWTLGVLTYELIYGNTPFHGKTNQDLFRHILMMKVVYPPAIPVTYDCLEFMKRCLMKNPDNRIGKKSDDELLSHPWFNSIDIKKLTRFELTPPIKPEIKHETDCLYFNKDITAVQPRLTFVNIDILNELKQHDPKFSGFYYNDLICQENKKIYEEEQEE